MCGRYSISKSRDELQVRFSVTIKGGDGLQRYNVAPTQLSAVITAAQPSEVQQFRWGLVPYNSASLSAGARFINARAETIREKYPFARLLGTNRCIIPADGFYEWKRTGKMKIPHRFTLADSSLFSFAGLWDAWVDKSTGEIIRSFTIVTVAPNELVGRVHDRMPAILTPQKEKLWLDAAVPAAEGLAVLEPFPANEMRSITVSSLVNSPLNDVPGVAEAAEYNIVEQGSLF